MSAPAHIVAWLLSGDIFASLEGQGSEEEQGVWGPSLPQLHPSPQTMIRRRAIWASVSSAVETEMEARKAFYMEKIRLLEKEQHDLAEYIEETKHEMEKLDEKN